MSSYQDRVWYDVLDIDAANIFLGRLWLSDLDVTNLSKSNTYEFKWNEKQIMLKPAKLKSIVGSNKLGTITDKKSKKSCHIVTKFYFSSESPIDRSTLKSRNFLGLLPLSLGISPIVTAKPPQPHSHEMHDNNTRQMTIIITISML